MNYTHHFIHLNYLAIAVGAAAYFLLGAVWYSPVLFAKPWAKITVMSMDDSNNRKGMATVMIASFLCLFVLAIGMAFSSHALHLQNWASGLRFGMLTGVCFGLTVMSVSFVYEIDGGYHLIGNIIVGIIVTVWK
ncbi:MAG: DUF1761 domain-containing protein [Bacteroidota bacterium]|nr:DUF1761 domain-containing protein [Bacteroidota bacterium]